MGQIPRNLSVLLATLLLAACGGGGGDGDSSRNSTASTSTFDIASVETDAPAATGNTATDGFNWFNFRRRQAGLQVVSRNATVDTAALGHSTYQQVNNTITHEQTEGRPAFTGVQLYTRLVNAGYQFDQSGGGYAYGEVISSTSSTSGVGAAEDLIAAIYHRFVILEPMFKEAGAGAATVSGGNTYFTTNFVANRLNQGLGNGKVIVYPFDGQKNVARNFMSDNESPDPVPDRNEVGYPISIHADILGNIAVQEFTVNPRGGGVLPVRLLSNATDPDHTPTGAVAIVPLAPLAGGTTYDVRFIGTVDGAQVTRNWSFSTR
ncbi:MAG TPA: CAP domain-containing protein [Noviherbaspirillum sp.]|jgi:uncharacterized protein YkwD|uniref:CAP domain-containing protein n=1 Tax=Noviherbaspirillum sp. TaxID=1926288 RepID=UPI002F9251B1